MAHIKKISFSRVGKNEGCICDKCGQYIRNIITVEYDFGILHYGQDCFTKMYNGGKLTTYGAKLMQKTLKSIEYYSVELAKYVSGEITADNDDVYKSYQTCVESYWTGRPYEEYRQFMIDEWFPERFKECQKQIDRFKNVNFEV